MEQAKSTNKRVVASTRMLKGARAALDLTQEELARAAGISKETLIALERGKYPSKPETRDSVQTALEFRGVVFTNGDNPGFYIPERRTHD